ncbi:MAG: hypothetical protein ABI586_05870 [Candidatus Nanopelagicales bacterium]
MTSARSRLAAQGTRSRVVEFLEMNWPTAKGTSGDDYGELTTKTSEHPQFFVLSTGEIFIPYLEVRCLSQN